MGSRFSVLFLKHPSTLLISPVAVSSLNIFTGPLAWHLLSVSHHVKLRWTSCHSLLVCAALGHLKLFRSFTVCMHMALSLSGVEEKRTVARLLSYLLWHVFSPSPTYHVLGIPTTELWWHFFVPSVQSPRDSLAIWVCSPATAGIPRRAVLSILLDGWQHIWLRCSHTLWATSHFPASQRLDMKDHEQQFCSATGRKKESITNVSSPCNGR